MSIAFQSRAPRRAMFATALAGAVLWLAGVQVHEVTCEAERCAVRVRLSMTMLTPPFIGQKIVNLVDETWVREDGQWWFYQAL